MVINSTENKKVASPKNIASPLTVTAGSIEPLGRLAAEAGISFSGILQRLGLSPDLLNRPRTSTISLADYFRILERLSILADDETCQLSSRPLLPGTTNYILSNLSECANLFEAMKFVAKSYNILHGGSYNRVEKRDGFLVYIIDDSKFPYSLADEESCSHFTMECVLILLHCMLSFIASVELSSYLRKIYSKRMHRDGESKYLAFWDVPIRCKSSTYALFYDITAESLPVTLSAADLPSSKTIYSKVIEMIEEKQRFRHRNRDIGELVREALELGVRDQTRVARRLGLSVATLRRRLKVENASFRHIRHQVLNESAKSLLKQHRQLGDVAEELGFSDFRSFTRAFKSWNGITPKTYIDMLTRKREIRLPLDQPNQQA